MVSRTGYGPRSLSPFRRKPVSGSDPGSRDAYSGEGKAKAKHEYQWLTSFTRKPSISCRVSTGLASFPFTNICNRRMQSLLSIGFGIIPAYDLFPAPSKRRAAIKPGPVFIGLKSLRNEE